jgi:hypothetical protein
MEVGMKKIEWAIVVMVGALLIAVIAVSVGWAGEREEAQLKLQNALLVLSNAQLQFNMKMAEDPGVQAAKAELNKVIQEIQVKYEIKQEAGKFVLTEKEVKK